MHHHAGYTGRFFFVIVLIKHKKEAEMSHSGHMKTLLPSFMATPPAESEAHPGRKDGQG